MTSRSREENREYMRDYMRARRRAARARERNFARRGSALYDPARDGPLHYASLTAMVMGDPPIGRRAIDQHRARTGVRSISLGGSQ